MSSVASAAGSARSTSSVLHEPLLNPRRPWDEEFTHPNGRGRAALTSFLLGIGAGGALLPLVTAPAAAPFCAYAILLIVFHFSEYALTAAFRPDTLSFDNFLLNHSPAYQIMVAVCWLEYWAEFALVQGALPGCKAWGLVSSLGLCMCLVGLLSRALGMATASSNFSHRIEEHKRQEHTLVTHGIYAWLRHPAYFGFFWFSVGTQLLLSNPLCLLLYAGTTFHFFWDRIPYEEHLLLQFFGDDYRRCARRGRPPPPAPRRCCAPTRPTCFDAPPACVPAAIARRRGSASPAWRGLSKGGRWNALMSTWGVTLPTLIPTCQKPG